MSSGGALARRRWSRFMPIVLAVGAIVATLSVILLLNVRISDGQYRLVELRAEERSLAQEAEALTQDLEFYQAPQNLAISASDEGMVQADSEGVIDLNSQEVSGDPEPAADGDDQEILLAQPVQSGSAAADRAAAIARERRDALPDTQEEADEQVSAANESEEDVDLHGGSLPAPQQRSPNDATATPTASAVPTGDPVDAESDENSEQDSAQDSAADADNEAAGSAQ